MKDEILEFLTKSDNYISGEELSKYFNVSRTAIWKAVSNLKKNGYEIESKSSKGYKLIKGEDNINETELKIIVRNSKVFDRSLYFDSIDSTNKHAKSLDSRDNIIIVAGEQVLGRGRLGRSWDSSKGEGLWMSFHLTPDIQPSVVYKITQVVSLSVVKGIKSLLNVNPLIKWPNDIVCEGKKVAGILTEMTTELGQVDKLVIGIGINVFHESFSTELSDKATSLKLIDSKSDISMKKLLVSIVEEFEKDYNEFLKVGTLAPFINDIRNYSALINKEVYILDGDKRELCVAKDIDLDGNLIVELQNNEIRKISYGEISIRGKKEYI